VSRITRARKKVGSREIRGGHRILSWRWDKTGATYAGQKNIADYPRDLLVAKQEVLGGRIGSHRDTSTVLAVTYTHLRIRLDKAFVQGPSASKKKQNELWENRNPSKNLSRGNALVKTRGDV